jgi:hypothetical protein
MPEEDIIMVDAKFLNSHRAWEDWLGIGLGLVIMLSPWITNEPAHLPTVANAAVVGAAIMMLAELDLVWSRRWTEWGLLIGGAWIALSPLVFGYAGSGALRVWHLSGGLLVAGLAALELSQQPAARYGRSEKLEGARDS